MKNPEFVELLIDGMKEKKIDFDLNNKIFDFVVVNRNSERIGVFAEIEITNRAEAIGKATIVTTEEKDLCGVYFVIPLILKADQETNSLLRNGNTKSEILTPEDFFEKFTDENGEKEKYPIDESTHGPTQLDELPRAII